VRPLRAGPLTLILGEEGDLRRISLGGLEVVRRLYFALRDRNWNTIPASLTDLEVHDQGRAFEIRYRATHLAGEIDFRWRASIRGDEQGTIRFEAAGRAYSDFLRNRIGLCVHHPLRECAGLRVRVNGRESEFPRLVSPHQVFTDFRQIRYTLIPGLDVELRFEGEIFETEDHRNWGDANYKTYGTPLRLRFPVQVKKGDEVRQVVSLRLLGKVPEALPPREEPQLTLEGRWRPLPPIGFGYVPGSAAIGPRPAHLRVDIRSGESPPKLDVPLELAIHLAPGHERDQLRALAPWKSSLARLLVFHEREKVTSMPWVELARQSLPGVTVVGGTNMWFAELNRERPPLPAPPVAFALSPQVHASDELSMVENLEAFPQMLESATYFLKGAPVHVTPITLKPRFNPVATDPNAPFENADARQSSDFAAAWTLGALASLLEGGPASLTFYETAGPRGLEDQGRRFPVFYLFEAIAAYYGGEFARTFFPGALRLRKGNRQALLLANLQGTARQFQLPPIAGKFARFRLLNGNELEPGSSRLVDIPPWGVLICEWDSK